ncbi:MAG: hypothetical protein ACHBN1_25570 [Heteroscytonema crispum UTEX LB 1556]
MSSRVTIAHAKASQRRGDLARSWGGSPLVRQRGQEGVSPIHDCRACFADLKELPWFPRQVLHLGRPQDRSGGPFTTAVHGLPTVGDWRRKGAKQSSLFLSSLRVLSASAVS